MLQTYAPQSNAKTVEVFDILFLVKIPYIYW